MTRKQIKPILIIGIIVMIGISACKGSRVDLPTAKPTPIPASTGTPFPLATPYAQLPAAGICAGSEGEMVKVTIYPDIPEPRCSKVRADQKLTVINQTQNTVQISIGRFSSSLEPGTGMVFDIPFGEYLAAGVHQLQVSPCCGPELWLEEK